MESVTEELYPVKITFPEDPVKLGKFLTWLFSKEADIIRFSMSAKTIEKAKEFNCIERID
jgi:hypothetical protein